MFKISLIEGIKNIDKNKIITYLSVILFTLLFILQSYTYSYHVVNNLQNENMEHETIKNYQIYQATGGGFALLQMLDPEWAKSFETVKQTAEFYDALENAKYLDYLTINSGGIVIENFKGDYDTFFNDSYFGDELFYVDALFTSPNFHKVENYRVIEGRDFTDEDMTFVEGGTRPVLLGYKYLETGAYKVGDILDWHCEGDYQPSYVTPKLEVIGFLAEDTTVIDKRGTHIIDLDTYIVCPRYFVSVSQWDSYSETVIKLAYNTDIYEMDFTRVMIDKDHEEEGVAELQKALDDYEGLSKYYKIVNRKQALEKIHTRTETFTNFAMAITGVLMAFAIVTVIFSVINRIENNLKDYAIHISIGASSINIIGFVISETVIILSCSVALGLIFSKWLMTELYMPYYFLEFLGIFAITSLLVILLSAITAKLALKKYDLCTLIK